MKRILFVDDEPRVLAGIRRMALPMRGKWEVLLAESAAESLELLDREPVDVVVSDIRMPVMDGATLLAEVKRRHPAVVRIVLSGQSDLDSVLRSVSSTHQYLTKPVDATSLRETIDRACALQDLLGSAELQAVISQVSQMPALPETYRELTAAIDDPDSSLASVARIISRDVGMTAKILQLVNSAFFGLRRHVSSPEQAATLLGLDTIRALVITVEVFKQFDDAAVEGFSLKAVESHCLTVGGLARQVAQAESLDRTACDDSFLAGVLHDLGKLILCANLPEQYSAVLAEAKHSGVSESAVEREAFGADHGAIGAYLTGLWGMSEAIQCALGFHHHPSDAPKQTFEPLTAVHLANALACGHTPDDDDPSPDRLDVAYLTPLGLDRRWSAWAALAVPDGEESAQP